MASLFSRARLAAFTKLAAGTAVAVPAGFHLWTRQCALDESFSPVGDPAFRHPLLRQANPRGNPDYHDSFCRAVPFDEVRPDLLEDALGGGSKLVETYSAGVWGKYAFNIQRKIVEKARKNESNAGDLWEKEELLKSTYPVGMIFADDFVVVDKSPTHLLFRGGLSPRVAPEGPREMDTFVGLTAELDPRARVARFSLKSVVFDGAGEGRGGPLGPVAVFMHQRYAKLLLTVGVDHCVA